MLLGNKKILNIEVEKKERYKYNHTTGFQKKENNK